MQLKLPIFPISTKLVSESLGVYEKDDIVQYIANGVPVYCHGKEDLNAFRFITSNFIHLGLCRKIEVIRCFHISEDSVTRSYNKYLKGGESAFFGPDGRKGRPHKVIGSLRYNIQKKLDMGQSVNSIGKELGVAESAIRYNIGRGYLKKTTIRNK